MKRALKFLTDDDLDMEQLRRYLEMNSKNKMRLATKMGYASSSVIDMWLKRGNLPKGKKAEIIYFLETQIAKAEGKKA